MLSPEKVRVMRGMRSGRWSSEGDQHRVPFAAAIM
jgi:hypothetical protein